MSVGEENETFCIRVWKPLPSRRILKTLRGSPEKNPKGTISASGNLRPFQRKTVINQSFVCLFLLGLQ